MQNLIIEKTLSSPKICFDAATGALEIRGESYPENVAKFYTPVLDWITAFLQDLNHDCIMTMDVPYFNSSTSKIFLILFDMLEQSAQTGKDILVKWMCERENEMAIECGDEFKEDLDELPFEIVLYE